MSNKRNNKQCSCSCKVNRGIIVVTSALSILFAQSRTVTGFVFDKEKQYPLQSVNIFVFGEDIGTVSKEDGSFEIQNIHRNIILSEYSRATLNVAPLNVA